MEGENIAVANYKDGKFVLAYGSLSDERITFCMDDQRYEGFVMKESSKRDRVIAWFQEDAHMQLLLGLCRKTPYPGELYEHVVLPLASGTQSNNWPEDFIDWFNTKVGEEATVCDTLLRLADARFTEQMIRSLKGE